MAAYRRKDREKKTTEVDDDHSLVLRQFSDSEDTAITSRAEAVTHRRYYDGHQWTDEEVTALEARGQPVITDNKIKDKIEYLLGAERKTRADPKAFPRNPSDEPSAEAATDALRYVADDNLFHYVRSDIAENMFIEGVGTCEIVIDKAKRYGKKGAVKVCVRQIRWDRSYADPHSFKCDYSDASYKGFITWMDYEEAAEKWPEKLDKLDACYEGSTPTEVTDDTPRFVINTQGRKRVQVFTHYYKRKGVWHHCVFVKGGFLEEPTPSAYEDEHGEPECPIEMQAMYKDGKDGSPYSQIRRYKDLQDDWNKRRSKSLNLLNTNQVLMEDGAAGNDPGAIERIRTEAAKPDGVITYIHGMKLDIRSGADLAQGHMNLMMQTGAALEATGPNSALSGHSGSISGRAKQLDQQGGSIAIDKPFDSVRYITLRIYRQIWNRIRQYWTEETWIRVRDEEQMRFVALNRRRMRAEVIAEELAKERISDEEKAAILRRVAADPAYRQEIIQNAVAEMDVDIIIDESPDIVTLQQEQFGMLAELAKGGVNIPPTALIEASGLRNKRKILDAMSGANDPMAAKVAEMEMKMKELGAMELEAKIRKIMSEVQKNETSAVESQVDASVKVAQFTDPVQPASPKTQVSVN